MGCYVKPIILYRDKKLDDYTKAELIEIVKEMGALQEADRKEHLRQLTVLGTHHD
jgi:hypothetical protein